jgi:hypothetical protein
MLKAKLQAYFQSLPHWAQATLEVIGDLIMLAIAFLYAAFIGYCFLLFFTEGYK